MSQSEAIGAIFVLALVLVIVTSTHDNVKPRWRDEVPFYQNYRKPMQIMQGIAYVLIVVANTIFALSPWNFQVTRCDPKTLDNDGLIKCDLIQMTRRQRNTVIGLEIVSLILATHGVNWFEKLADQPAPAGSNVTAFYGNEWLWLPGFIYGMFNFTAPVVIIVYMPIYFQDINWAWQAFEALWVVIAFLAGVDWVLRGLEFAPSRVWYDVDGDKPAGDTWMGIKYRKVSIKEPKPHVSLTGVDINAADVVVPYHAYAMQLAAPGKFAAAYLSGGYRKIGK